MMKYSLLIQGPLNATSLNAIDKCGYGEQVDEVVISHWSCDKNKEELLQKIPTENITIVESKLPEIPLENGAHDTAHNMWYGVSSTHEGLKKCKGKFTIKIRSDEYYEDFGPLKELSKNNPDKMIFGNIFAKNFSYCPYHIGDHLFVANTNRLRETYEWFTDVYENYKKEDVPWWMFQSSAATESVLARSFVHTGETSSGWENSTESFLKWFECIDINKLKPYFVRWGHANQEWNSETNPFVWHITSTEDMIK